jgi:glyoxylase-like metal-dependent hydrolase (beta-lactamase superfamily II)
MAFLTEPEPPRGVATEMLPGIRRLVANNPSVMTYLGTNTYIVEGPDGLIVLDPGPREAAHVAAIVEQAGAPIALILLSHTHSDHLGAVPELRQRTGAPVAAWRSSPVENFAPDVPLDDGQTIAGMTALHTPGHAPDHLCFGLERDGRKILFSADHVMSWSSSIVNPPEGDMADYFSSLRRVLDRDDDVYLPGHGPMLPKPQALAADLLAHRQVRERAIRDALDGRPPTAVRALTDELYSQTHPMLKLAAERNVLAHLIKLEREGVVARDGELWRQR